ncbi:MAG: ABC transporter ATP-binding protein [Saprospiraceae bacterium]
MKYLAYLNKFFFKYKWHFLLGLLFVSASNYFRVLMPQMIREAMDLVIDNIALYKIFDGSSLQNDLFKHIGNTLLFFGVLVLLLALLMGVFMYFMRQTIIVMSRLIEYDLRKEIFDHYQVLDLAFFKRNKTGDLMARITEDVSKVRMYLGPAILYGINLSTLFVLVIYAMISVSPTLTLYALAPLPFLSISIYYVSNLINIKSEAIQKRLAGLNSVAQEVYSGIRVVKSYVQEIPMGKYFAKKSVEYKDEAMGLAKINALFFPLMLLLIGTSTILTVYIGGLQVVKGTLTPGNIAEFVIYVNMLTWPVTAIGWIASIIQQAAASQKRLNEFLNTEPTVQNPGGKLTTLNGDIRFENVSFTYPDTGIKALENIDFHLRPGAKLAIIGRTGSGKSTIADLLVRMYDVSTGQILIDGQNIQDINLHQLRRKIGYVPQDMFLFSDTIAENIAFGCQEAVSRPLIESTAKSASVYDDIMDFPEGFDTPVGERGVTLSGGQKQRISIARALIKKPDLLILDDCLSAVDTKTEKEILGYFEKELTNKTAIIITHRIYSLLDFDKIIVLDNGKMVEQGKHEDLLELKGYYYDLFEQQLKEQERER